MRRRTTACLASLLLLASGCAESWPEGPYVWAAQGSEAFEAAVPPAHRTDDLEILYVTDRTVSETTPEGPHYGSGRSPEVAYGAAVVGFDPPETFDALARMTAVEERRDRPLKPLVRRRVEIARFGRRAADLELRDQALAPKEETLAREKAAQQTLRVELERRLSQASRQDVVLFINGVDYSFDESVVYLAQVWNACGRVGVPIAYAWPAGVGGFLGYSYDRESGDFTVRHLRNVLLFLADTPGVERVHVLTHSRGSDIATAALRELHLVAKAKGESTRRKLKLETLVFSAPDLDTDVFEERFLKEELYATAGRMTIYFNHDDCALNLLTSVLGSRSRMGNFKLDEIDPEARARLASLPDVELVRCDVHGRSSGHNYSFFDPSAMSDLALLLRDGARAGSPARPLERAGPGIWRLTNEYLRPARLDPSQSKERRRDDRDR
jgi:esterase/lipase superfamily enzyme